MRDRAGQLRKLIGGEEIVAAPGVMDAVSARAAEDAGFKAIYLGGYVMGQTAGVTEPLMTMTETAQDAARIAGAVEVPLIIDGGAGFGDLLHVRRTIRALADAGVAGVHVEDQVFPKRARYFEGYKHVLPRDEAIEKIRMAAAACRDHGMVLIGRTDAREAEGGGLDEALWRCEAFLDAGAELVMPYATCAPSAEEAADTVRRLSGPALYVASEGKTGYAELSVTQLQGQGWRVVVHNISCLMASYRAVRATLRSLRETGRSGLALEEAAQLRREVETLSKLPEMYEIERAQDHHKGRAGVPPLS